MHIEKEYSFVLTSKNEVLLIGNFASLLNIPDNAKPEFLKLPFLNQMKIIKISCAYSCALFLSEDGMVYSWGKDPNKRGLLGTKEVYQTTPCPLSNLINYCIKDFSLGLNHACAIDKQGKLFTWGYGEQGELGHGDEVTQIDTPLLVKCLDQFKVRKATATSNSTLFLTESNQFGMFYGGNLIMFHSVYDYVASEIFIGIVTEEKLMILTQNCQLFEIDSIFGIDGYQHGQFILVGFQDSLMLFSDDLIVIHWEIIALNKCRKTVYSLSEKKLDCLSDLNQIFATLNRIPFLIGNETPLKIKKLSSYFLTPIKTDLAEWIYTGKIHRKTFSSHSCQEYLNKEFKINSYSRNIEDNLNYSEERKSTNENLCNIETQKYESISSQLDEQDDSVICEDQVKNFEPISNEIEHQLPIREDEETEQQNDNISDKQFTGSLLFLFKLISGIAIK